MSNRSRSERITFLHSFSVCVCVLEREQDNLLCAIVVVFSMFQLSFTIILTETESDWRARAGK